MIISIIEKLTYTEQDSHHRDILWLTCSMIL